MKRLSFLLALAALVRIAFACTSPSSAGSGDDGSGSSSGSCDRTLPKCPPSGSPTYADVAPVFTQQCTTECHFAGSTQAREDFTTYAKVYAARGSILSQVYACNMPPQPRVLAASERSLILTWLECGAPASPDLDASHE